MSTPLIAHIVYRLDYGGLENGLVNLINGLPLGGYRHAVICLTTFTDFRDRIVRDDVEVFALDKRPGKDPKTYLRLWRLLRRLRPQVVHTRNTGTIDCSVIAFLAGVPVRLHGYHGWDAADLHGRKPRGVRLRRWCNPFIATYVTVSQHLADWLVQTQGVAAARVRHICNGVDTDHFHPGVSAAEPLFAEPGGEPPFVIGTVGRMDPVKDQCTLVRAFVDLVHRHPGAARHVRLVLVGDGEMRSQIAGLLAAAGLDDTARICGWRDDIGELLKQFDVFVLPSLNEGISNTLLEAMATGLPIVATRVGGNVELIIDGETGVLVDAGNAGQVTAALERYVASPGLARSHGEAGLRRARTAFSIASMLAAYDGLYREVIFGEGVAGSAAVKP